MSDRFIATVSQVNRRVGLTLGKDEALSSLCVRGEVSNFVRHYKSGHIYFTLKDDEAALKCVMFSLEAESLNFEPENGQIIIANGRISVYERDGVYQLYVSSLEPDEDKDADKDSLFAQFLKLKEKLEAQGIFSNSRPLPAFPKKICLITSKDGAALQDILSVFARRYPLLEAELIPVAVQGKTAPESLIKATSAAQKTGADLIILARGGGSAEDLWAFNDEALAREIFKSKIPVISAVGHETDFTIADFAADLRAPTPSAAAEIAVPDMSGYISELENLLAGLKQKIHRTVERKLSRLENAERIIEALSPEKVFKRGYAAVFGSDGKALKNSNDAEIGEELNIRLSQGSLTAIVKEKK